MKKLLLLSTSLLLVICISAQQRALLPRERRNQAVEANEFSNVNGIPVNSDQYMLHKSTSMLDPSEHLIGTTIFDSQTNKLLQHRIIRHADGTIGAVWTMGKDYATGFPDRGTGYNFYNGSEWGPIPDSRIENFRAGWPSYAPYGPNGEVIFSHDFATGQIYFHTREQRGTGDWVENVFSYTNGPPEGVSHPKVITGGVNNNIIHLLANSYDDYMGLNMAMLYSRSQDGGQSWDIQNLVIEGTGDDYYNTHVRDMFVFAEERAGTIAILNGWPWHDLFMLKSTDNGESWEKTIIWEHPYPFFDWDKTITDTFFCMDNSASIALDLYGKAHIVFGINRVLHDTPGTGYWLFPDVDGIGYWNEDMETFSNDIDALAPPDYGYANSEMILDENYIGWMQDVNGNGSIDLNSDIFFYRQLGASTMPTISIDDQDRIFVIYASTTETFEYENYNYKHLWARAYENGFWGPFLDLNNNVTHMFDECINPVLASTSDGNIHFIYNADAIPGLAQRDDHEFIENRIIYGSLPKSDILTGLDEMDGNLNDELNLLCHPNPCSGALTIQYSVFNIQNTKLEMYAVDGVKVKTLTQGYQQPGEHIQSFDISDLPNGMYFVRLQVGEIVETTKLILLK